MGQTLIRQKTSCCPFLLKPRFKFTRSNYNIVQMDKVLGGSGCDWEPSRGDIRPFYSSWVLQHTNQLKWGFFSFYLTIDNCQKTQITIVTCLIFGASLPDGQVHHLARGRNCPLEIRTPEPRTQDGAKKEMSGRVRRRPRSLRG